MANKTYLTLSEKLEPIYIDLENLLWEKEANDPTPIGVSDTMFRAATKIFMSALLEKMFEHIKEENLPLDKAQELAKYAGEKISELVMDVTSIDTKELYKKDGNINVNKNANDSKDCFQN